MLQRTWSKWMITSALSVTALGGGTGCAGFDIKGALVAKDTAPMQTVVRRADVARATVNNVERIISNLPVDTDSKWVAALVFKKSDAEALMKDIATDAEFASPTGQKLNVVPAEAWAVLLSKVCSQEKAAPSMYGELNGEVHSQYLDIATQAKQVGKLKSDIAIEKDAIGDEARASEKADHEAKKKDLEDKLDQLEKDYRPKVDAFKKRIGDETAKASPELKKQIAPTVSVLRRALADAKVANSAAAIGYTIALKGIKDEVKLMVKRIAADALQAQIGTRPNMDKLTPEVKLSPVSITIGGLTPADVGRLKLDDAVKDIADRSKSYVVHVVTLLGFIDETREMIALQSELLEEVAKGVGEVSVGEDFGDLAITATVAPGRGDKRFPVPMDACVVVAKVEPPPPPVTPDPPAKPTTPAKPTKGGKKK